MEIGNTNWNFPTTIWFGSDRIEDLPAACKQIGIKNPLFVTDEGLVKLEIVATALNTLEKSAISFSVYSDVQGNPTGKNVTKGVEHYRKHGHDGVIAFGGGSAIDAAKTIAFMSGQTKSIWDFEDAGDNWSYADVNGIAPIIAIPTTAGTGSEVGRASVITAWTGVDAMVHAIEAFCAPGYHPMAEGIAVEAIRLIAKYLPKAFKNGNDLEARGQMLVAASMGATAFQKGLGSVHSVAHQLGAIYNKQHGLLNAIILPYALAQNSDVIEEKMNYLAKVLDLESLGADAVIAYLIALRAALNIPNTLVEIGVDNEKAIQIGEMAFKDPSTPSNAKPVDAKDLENLFRAAQSGDLTYIK